MDRTTRDRWLALNYGAAIFVSAFLLFQIQPLVSKRLLPWFGGSPAVWTTCLLFFQALLVVGYAYAHGIHRWLSPSRQVILQTSLILIAIALLRVLPGEQWAPQAQDDPLRRILLVLTVSVGLPYFLLAATGPLLQAWFAQTFPRRNPYRLYALSNVGSLLALVTYPFFFERQFDMQQQALLWSVGFIGYAILVCLAAWRMWANKAVTLADDSPATIGEEVTAPTWTERFLWLVLPACGSIVLMATTNHVSTDIAVMPLLWIAPLALYLITFIIVFDRPNWYRPTLIAAVTLAAIYGAAFVHKNGIGRIDPSDCGTVGWLYQMITNAPADNRAAPDASHRFRISSLDFLAVNFAAMFFICFLCHGELVRRRPHPRYLTSFYLMIAAGGALGGTFVALIAPRIFATYLEWELSLAIAAIGAVGLILRAFVNSALADDGRTGSLGRILALPLVAMAVFLPIAMVLLDLAQFLPQSNAGIHLRERNFFGALAVRERSAEDPLARKFVLQHGVIAHGAQFLLKERRREPITYFGPDSGVGLTIEYFRIHRPTNGLRLGVVGLGAGTLAAYADKGDRITFYEINPAVTRIAKDGRWFTYLQDCMARGATCEVEEGDGRLVLQRELDRQSPRKFDLLILDAFSGDAVPVHLLTIEAFDVYLAHLAGKSSASGGQVGAIAVNISNRFADLEPVLRGVAARFDLRWVRIHNRRDPARGVYSADWIILSRNDALMETLGQFARTPVGPPRPDVLWTDTYSSLYDVLK